MLSEAEKQLAAQDAADHAKLAELYRDPLTELSEMLRTNEKPLTMKEKLSGFGGFMKLMADPANARVARIFVLVTILMFAVPMISLFLGMHVIAPALGVDAGTCGGVCALVMVVTVMGSYVVFVLNDEVFNEKKQEASMRAHQQPKKQTRSTTSVETASVQSANPRKNKKKDK